MAMFYFVYKTIDLSSGKFYIGKHSTRDVNDGYAGSGNWVVHCKRLKRPLVTGVVEFFSSEKEAFEFEKKLILKAKGEFGKTCMNLADGGWGQTSEAMNKLCGDPSFINKLKLGQSRAHAEGRTAQRLKNSATRWREDEELKRKHSDIMRNALSDPATKVRMCEASKITQNRPELRENQRTDSLNRSAYLKHHNLPYRTKGVTKEMVNMWLMCGGVS